MVASVNNLRIGSDPADSSRHFNGSVDEVSIYIASSLWMRLPPFYNASSLGKCLTPAPPAITTQPTNQTVVVGGTTTFNVMASGTPL